MFLLEQVFHKKQDNKESSVFPPIDKKPRKKLEVHIFSSFSAEWSA